MTDILIIGELRFLESAVPLLPWDGSNALLVALLVALLIALLRMHPVALVACYDRRRGGAFWALSFLK